MKKITVMMIVVLTVLSLASSAFAFGPGRQGRENGHGTAERRERMVEELGLSPEQEEQLELNREANRAEFRKLRDEMKKNRKALHEALKKPEMNKAEVDAAVSSLKDTQGKIIDRKVEGFVEMKDVLTEEQFNKLMDRYGGMRKNRRQRMRERLRNGR